ncbi:MAG: caspase family protein [Leptospiraceae bacterium]|nr:caspase family protein [Leptospiraceae bacterium]MDW7975015.1 caspase family protein [Leptospiraceae bacterium]
MFRKYFLLFLLFSISLYATEGRRIAVIFGTNYKGNEIGTLPLDLCEADAKLMEQSLRQYGQYDVAKVYLGSMVTASNVKSALEELAKISNKEDVIFLYFSGHGTYQRDQTAPNGIRNFLIMYHRPHISDKELNEWMKGIRGKVVWVFDCCFSGGIVKKGGQTRGVGDIPIPENSPGIVIQNADQDFYFRDAVLIGSSDSNETSIEIRGEINHGIFTYYFANALNPANGDLNQDKTVTLYEAFTWAAPKVTEHAKKYRHKQTPQLRGNASGYLVSGNLKPILPPPPPKPTVVSPQPEVTLNLPSSVIVEPITEEEPPVIDQGNYGTIEIATTILKSRQAGQNTMDPTEILKKNRIGDVERKIRVLVSGNELPYQVQWLDEKELQKKLDDEIPLGVYSYQGKVYKNQVAYIIIKKVPVGVHEIQIEADDYPVIKKVIGVEKNKTSKEMVVVSLANYGSIKGKVFYKNFEQPLAGYEVWMPTITGTNLIYKMKTTKNGSFWFLNLPPSDFYQLKLSFLENVDLENRFIKVRAGEVVEVDVVLNKKNVRE